MQAHKLDRKLSVYAKGFKCQLASILKSQSYDKILPNEGFFSYEMHLRRTANQGDEVAQVARRER